MQHRYIVVIAIVLLMGGSLLYQKYLDDGFRLFGEDAPPDYTHADYVLNRPVTTKEAGKSGLGRKKETTLAAKVGKQQQQQQQQQQPAVATSAVDDSGGPSGFPRYGPRCIPQQTKVDAASVSSGTVAPCVPERIRVAFVHFSMPFGGCETQFYRLAQHMDRSRFELIFIMHDDTDGGAMRPLFEELGYKFEIFKVWKPGDGPANPAEWNRMVNRLKEVDVTFGFYGGGWKTIKVNEMASAGGVPVNIESIAWTVEAQSPNLDAIVADSDLLAQMQRPGRNVVRVNVSVDTSRFDFAKFVPHGRPHSTMRTYPVIGWLARLIGNKNPAPFVHAAAIISERFPDATFVMYGEGDAKASMEKLARDKNVMIEFKGSTHDVPAAMAAMDIYIFTPAAECNPNVLYEAMSMGCLIITSRAGSIPELIKNEVNGLLVMDPSDAVEIAEKVSWALSHLDRVKQITKNAQEQIAKYHSLQAYIEGHQSLFTKLCEEKCCGAARSRAPHAFPAQSTASTTAVATKQEQQPDEIDTVLSTRVNGKNQCPTGYQPRCKLTLAILAMQGEATLQNTLRSYRDTGLLDFVGEKLIWWQQIDRNYQSGHSKRAATDSFPGFRVVGTNDNLGYGAIEKMFQAAQCEYVMFLEEDFVAREGGDVLIGRLNKAMALLESGGVQAVRLRHRVHYGEPMWAKQTFQTRGSIEETHELWSVVWTYEPEKMYPKHIRKCVDSPIHWCALSKYADFSTNPFMMQREWFLTEMAPHVEPNWHKTEAATSEWWRSKNITVAVGDGIFEHLRLDRT